MAKKDNIKISLQKFGNYFIEELGKELKRNDKEATGELIRSLDSRVRKTGMGTDYTLEILSLPYLIYVDEGRRPGKFPPIDKIRNWTIVKGIPTSAAYPIALKIKEEGIKPTNIIQKSVDNILKSRKYKDFEDDYYDEVDDVIDQYLIKLSKNKNITFSK